MKEKPTIPEWLAKGFSNIWLPYAQMKLTPTPLPVIGAEGVTLHLADGRKLIDGVSSWWSACHGYQHPALVKAIQEQAAKLSHVMFAGLAHEPAYTLTKRLVNIVPDGLTRVFFSDSGSTAIEVALKMAVQFWANRGERRAKFIAFRNGYHGDTMGCMSLTLTEESMHRVYKPYLPEQFVLEIPTDEYSLAEFTELLASGLSKSVAAMVIEPLVQSAGGMKFHSPDILAELYRLCKKYGIIFIADEVATGFGRTGSMFACEEAGITPDILCLGKALSGGMLPLAATLVTEETFNAFLSEKLEHALMHGPTYMANPIACAVANASLDLFEKEPRLQQVEAIEKQMAHELAPCRNFPNVANIRVKGAIGVVELKNTSWEKMFAMRQKAIEQGVWLRPFGNIIYLTPAFTVSDKELTALTQAIRDLCATL